MNGNIVYSKQQNTVTAREMRLDFARKHMKDPAQICKKKYNILYDGNQFGRRREAAHDISMWRMVEAVLWHGNVWLPMEVGNQCLLMM